MRASATSAQSVDTPGTLGFPLQVTMRGGSDPAAREQLERGLLELVHLAPRPILHGTVTMTFEHDPALEHPALIRASLDVSGRPLFVRASAPEMKGAVSLLLERLRRGLREQAERYESRRRQARSSSRD